MSNINVNISTNWQILEGAIDNLANVTILENTTKKNLEADVVDAERTTVLSRYKNDDKTFCSIRIQAFGSFDIKFLSFAVTSCKKLETFYGSQDEYCSLIQGTVYEEMQPMEIYRYDIRALEGNNTMKIRLFPNDDSIIIFGINIEIALSALPKTTTINMDNVQEILNECNINLSEKGQRCKEFLSNYMQRANGNQINVMNSLIDTQNQSKTNSILTNEANGNKAELNSDEEKENRFDLPEILNTSNPLATLAESTKQYLDYRLQLLEVNLWNKIESRMNEMETVQNEKLHKIITLLTKNKLDNS